MPKQLYKITQFHGGLNSNSDARDIAENELSEANDVMVDELGKIRLMGGISTSNMPAARANQINPGYGLFQFSHDRLDGHTAGSGAYESALTGADYLVLSDPHQDEGQVDIYSSQDTTWGNPITGMGDNSSGLRADVFYSVDGNLRVCDSDFGNSNSNKWYGYVSIRHFGSLTPGGGANTYNTWISANSEILAPTRGLAGTIHITQADGTDSDTITESGWFNGWSGEINQDHLVVDNTENKTADIDTYTDSSNIDVTNPSAAITDFTDNAIWIFPPAGTGFNVEIYDDSTTVDVGVPAGTYELASTFIYDKEPGDLSGGAQESLPFKLAMKTFAVDAEDRITIRVLATSIYAGRIRGGRIYMRIVDSNDPWNQIAEISLKDGVRINPDDSYEPWYLVNDDNNDTSIAVTHNVLRISELLPITYEMNTGINQNAPSITAKYKTAVVANRIAYIGNVEYDDITYGDAVFKSPVNKFDIFTSDRKLESSVADGDSIVKLETYADRILIFKKSKMELLNISQEVEFLEDTFMHKGVSHPAATCKTDFGIAWVNNQGCYLYDGQKVNNLLEKQGRQIIKESVWEAFVNQDSSPMIGYIPKKRQLIVVDGFTDSEPGGIYIYDIVTQSWVKGSDKMVADQARSNLITDWNGDLVFAHTSDTGTFVKWDDASDSSAAVDIKTKDIDFGNPGQKKTVYKVYISYKGDGSSTTVKYGINGETDSGDLYAFDSANLADKSSAENLESWHVATLVPGTASQAKNIYSFQIILGGTAGATFEINDITIVYRLKGMR